MRGRTRFSPPDGWVAPSGICECGCGGKTGLALRSNTKKGWFAGYPMRFIRGHHVRTLDRPVRWKGGRWTDGNGRVWVSMPEHHLANHKGYVAEHRLVCEQTIGRRLRPGEEVHHVDGNPSNNAPENLMAVTRAEHMAIHAQSAQTRERISRKVRAHYAKPGAHEERSDILRRAWVTRRARQKESAGH